MGSEFVVATEKGDKNLSLLLRSATRRFGKYVALGGLAAALVATATRPGGGGPALRPVARAPPHGGHRPNPALRPPADRPARDAWRSLTRRQITRDQLACDFGQERPVHDAATWIGMREAYVSIVGADAATLDPAPGDVGAGSPDAPDALATAFRSPVEVRQSPGKGRGIFSLTEVRKGALLYDFSQSGQFRHAADYAEFLRILRPDLACDVLMWSYVQDFGAGGAGAAADLRMVTDLDAGSFCNDGHRGQGNAAWLDAKGRLATAHPPHVALVRRDGTVRGDAVRSAPLVAVRDIRAGEELYCVYGQFSAATSKFMK